MLLSAGDAAASQSNALRQSRTIALTIWFTMGLALTSYALTPPSIHAQRNGAVLFGWVAAAVHLVS